MLLTFIFSLALCGGKPNNPGPDEEPQGSIEKQDSGIVDDQPNQIT